jgi:hypothetical protein
VGRAVGMPVGASVGVVGALLGAPVGVSVGVVVCKQLVELSGPLAKPSEHMHTNWSPFSTQYVDIVSHPWEPSSHGCSVGMWVGASVGVFEGASVGNTTASAGMLVELMRQLVKLPASNTKPSKHTQSKLRKRGV